MNIFLGNISLRGKNYQIYIGDKHTSLKESVLVFTDKSIDEKWLKDIELTSRADGDTKYISDSNRYYLILYLLFSIKRRIYFTDLLSIYDSPLEDIIPQICSKNTQDYLWDKLDSFMKEHNYKWKFINDYPGLYAGTMRVPLNYYSFPKTVSPACFSMLSNKIIHAIEIRTIMLGNFFWRNCFLLFQSNKFKKQYHNMSRIKVKGESGNIFFKAVDQNEKSVFIKQGNNRFSDIHDESAALSILKSKSERKELYLLPYEIKSDFTTLVFPFNSDVTTLQNADNDKAIQTSDIDSLIYFACDVIDDLRQCKIIHRDIHPENILVQFEQKRIKGFQLIDFGCAISGNEIRHGIRQKRKNRYAGKAYRYNDIIYNDAYSFLYMIIQLKNFDASLNKNALNELIKRLSTQ